MSSFVQLFFFSLREFKFLAAHQPWVFLAPRAVSIFNSLSALTTVALSVASSTTLPLRFLNVCFQSTNIYGNLTMCKATYFKECPKNRHITQTHKHSGAYSLGRN